MIDLHTHSNVSDGSNSPSELAAAAARIGLRAIALTDHDTTASHDEMARACEQVGIEHVTGVEISLLDAEFPRERDGHVFARGVHVLAYFVPLEPDHPFQQLLGRLREDRARRNSRLVERLRGLGFERLTLAEVAARAGNDEGVGRPHFAAAMFDLHPEIVGERTPENWSRVFSEWLGTAGRAYLPKSLITIEEAVAAARGSGTVFSVAHPLLNYLPEASLATIEKQMPKIMDSLRSRGVLAIEALYGSSPAPVRSVMAKLARDHRLIATGGSDYHGLFKENVTLGRGLTGDLNVPDYVLDELRAARE